MFGKALPGDTYLHCILAHPSLPGSLGVGGFFSLSVFIIGKAGRGASNVFRAVILRACNMLCLFEFFKNVMPKPSQHTWTKISSTNDVGECQLPFVQLACTLVLLIRKLFSNVSPLPLTTFSPSYILCLYF